MGVKTLGIDDYQTRRRQEIDSKCIGNTFERLECLYREDKLYVCRCICGKELRVKPGQLNGGYIKSCGCLKRDNMMKLGKDNLIHGLYVDEGLEPRSRELNSYWAMMTRCYNEKDPAYERYGGVGKVVCDEWRGDPVQFISDMGTRPPDTTLDRKDNTKGYSPDNCRWSDKDIQGQNKSSTILSKEVVKKIRVLIAGGWTAREVRDYLDINCHISTIQLAASQGSWNNV